LDRITRHLDAGGQSVHNQLPVWGSLKRRTSTPGRRRDYRQQHSRIVTALADRDPAEAEAAVRGHLRDVSENMLGQR
jgi:DNA-binding FadR family transcriptional regulator